MIKENEFSSYRRKTDIYYDSNKAMEEMDMTRSSRIFKVLY